MAKINPVVLENLKASLMGRLKLRLYERISGTPGIVPSEKQLITYFEKNYKDNHAAFGLAEYILVDGRYAEIEAGLLKHENDIELDPLLRELDKNPPARPFFFEITDYAGYDRLGVWIKCHLLAGMTGHFYEIAILEEEHLMDSFGLCEIRTSQEYPEPAFCYYNDDLEFTRSGRKDTDWKANFSLRLGLQVMKFMNESYSDHFISMEQAFQKDRRGQLKMQGPGPADPVYTKLVQQLFLKRIKCHSAVVDAASVIPLSFDACFSLSVSEINEGRKFLKQYQQEGIVVYWKDGHFIMSDDYLPYMVFRVSGLTKFRVIILGNEGTKGLAIERSGDFRLLPSLHTHLTPSLDAAQLGYRKVVMDEYIGKLAAINSLKDLFSSKCVVFSEDTHTGMLEALLSASGFDAGELTIMSYENCTKLDLLPLTLQTIRKVKSNMVFVVHRDRDYLSEEEVQRVEARIVKLGAHPFISTGTDIESHLLNGDHINYLYPQLSVADIEAYIDQATLLSRDISITKMLKNKYGDKYKGHLAEKPAFEALYDSSPLRYRAGKETLGRLKGLLQPRIGNTNLLDTSPFIASARLAAIAAELWPY